MHNKGLQYRPDWDTYFLTMAYLIAQRSIDESTLCGCVIVSKDRKILAQGYNGPIANSNDRLIPQTRPDKYPHFLHSEENALLNYSGPKSELTYSTIYVTGRPCSRCLRMILQSDIRRIVYAKSRNAKCVDENDEAAQKLMLEYIQHHIEIKQVDISNSVPELLHRTLAYVEERAGA